MIHGSWKSVTITAGQLSTAAIDLGRSYQEVLVLIPALVTTATVSLSVSDLLGGDYYPLYALGAAATGDFASATTTNTVAKSVAFKVGGAQFIKVVISATQAANATFKVCGIRN